MLARKDTCSDTAHPSGGLVNAVTGPSVQLASGAYLDLLDPDPAVLSINVYVSEDMEASL